ncbi:MAG: hypothetical protein HY291_23450 [Planctomycetes bacterium]|nr:hypothetical protein [Planctomycetota bacterium]
MKSQGNWKNVALELLAAAAVGALAALTQEALKRGAALAVDKKKSGTKAAKRS